MLFQKRLIILIFFISTLLYANDGAKVNIGLGYGTISGNIPDFSCFAIKGGIEAPIKMLDSNYLRLELFAAKKYTFLFPSAYHKYYSYLYGANLSALFTQQLDKRYFLEESVGYMLLFDRIYEQEKQTNNGISLSGALGINLNDSNEKQQAILISINYGLSLTGNNTSFFILSLSYKVTL